MYRFLMMLLVVFPAAANGADSTKELLISVIDHSLAGMSGKANLEIRNQSADSRCIVVFEPQGVRVFLADNPTRILVDKAVALRVREYKAGKLMQVASYSELKIESSFDLSRLTWIIGEDETSLETAKPGDYLLHLVFQEIPCEKQSLYELYRLAVENNSTARRRLFKDVLGVSALVSSDAIRLNGFSPNFLWPNRP